MFGNNGCSESIDATAADSGMAQQLEKVHISTLPLLPSQPQKDYDYAERAMNMTLFDPPRWGWAAVGGVADLLTPHEVRLLMLYMVITRNYYFISLIKDENNSFLISIHPAVIFFFNLAFLFHIASFSFVKAITETQYMRCLQKEIPKNETKR